MSCPLSIETTRNQAYSLAQKGYNPAEAALLAGIESPTTRLNYLRRNMETMVNHVFEDSAVSFTNHYQMNDRGEVVSYPDGIVLNIDPDERGGLNKFGIESAVWGALENPNQVVLLYSPPGLVVFDDDPNNKFRDIKPYTDGQLYLMYSDGKKVDNVAISISDGGEKQWVSRIMPREYATAQAKDNEMEKVKYWITTPLLTGMSIDEFMQRQEKRHDTSLFKNKDGKEFSLFQTLTLIRASLAGKLEQSRVVEDVLQSIDIGQVTFAEIDRIYGLLAQCYMQEKGVEKMTLGGSCGGTEIRLDPVSDALDNLSTNFRLLTQGKNIPTLLRGGGEKPQMVFEHKPGHVCNKCGANGQEVKLGPCNICETCQVRFDSGEFE